MITQEQYDKLLADVSSLQILLVLLCEDHMRKFGVDPVKFAQVVRELVRDSIRVPGDVTPNQRALLQQSVDRDLESILSVARSFDNLEKA